MMDLLDDGPDAGPGSNAPEFTVSELSGAVKRTLEGEFGRIRVRGEIGRVVKARSGHIYYDVKDDRNVLACTTWKGQAAKLSVQPEEGLEVIVTGRLTAYGAQSKYNMNVEEIEVAGAGALMAMLEKRRVALQAEGLFAPERKQPIPYLPGIIGVVTSPTGAVIRDILHRLRDRFPRKVLIWPVAVQGQNCAAEVANAIKGFNALTPGGALPRPDLLIVARGGGSLEDLWGFNEEIVVRAAAASAIPLISAVGHETDTTLIDFASDRRAPTPTAAAEMAVPVRADLLAGLEAYGARLIRAAHGGLEYRGQRLRDLSRGLPRPQNLLGPMQQRLDLAADRLPQALQNRVNRDRIALSRLDGRASPQALRERLRAQGARLADLAARLDAAPARRVQKARDQLAAQRLTARPVQRLTERGRERLAGTVQHLSNRAERQVERLTNRLTALDRQRLSLGYEETIKRGYAVVWAGKTVVTSAAAAAEAGALEVQFADGRFKLGGSAKPKGKPKPPEQGSLF